ncbi:universal stress protein PHOS32 [Sesamum indicum]|uniref:Universal stress protein PHOS32 n=1 Tax=Sesamum indicum TaxID=4182 RepID=A0A6I9UGT8_SESIN|nr:universal stress protein PHOS32 [Sesamum indicum]
MGGCRRVGVAVDFSPCSKKALQWAVDNLVRKGDHLILVSVRPEGYYETGEMQLWETTGSPLIPLSDFSNRDNMKKYQVSPDPETLDIVSTASNQKEIVVLMKIFWGDAREKLCESIDSIPLDCLVIGNRGLGKIKRALMGSVSNFVVNNASCPVTVVKSHD